MLRVQFHNLAYKLALWTWLEGESTAQTNFGDVEQIPGCSSGAALVSSTRIAKQYYVEYDTRVRDYGEQEVWISARIPKGLQQNLAANVGGARLTANQEGVGSYGAGFAWYRMGLARLSGPRAKIRIEIDAPSGADIAIDAVLMVTPGFRPSGVTPPQPMVFKPTPKR